jgi:hypothetical protein
MWSSFLGISAHKDPYKILFIFYDFYPIFYEVLKFEVISRIK